MSDYIYRLSPLKYEHTNRNLSRVTIAIKVERICKHSTVVKSREKGGKGELE